MWKRLGLWVLIIICLMLILPVGQVYADSSSDVTVTASGYVCGAPGAFTLTYINDYEVGISWTKGTDAVNTMIRAAFGRVPEDISDGYQVYYDTGTFCTDNAISLSSPEVIYYVAWSQNAGGQWGLLFASGDTGGFMSASFLFIGLIMIACFLTYLSSRRPNILVAFAAGLTWLGMAFWLLLGNVTNLQLTSSWTQVIAWVFVIMTFVPFLLQINVEIQNEAGGRRWTSWGKAPSTKKSGYEEYKEKLYRRTRGG
jgi:hypothetical protein